MTANRGTFVVIDGCEGVGKTTQIKRLKEKYGDAVVFTREPGGSSYAEAIRELLLKNEFAKDASDETQLMLFNAARRDHLEKTVLPALEAGKTVICDRYDSTSYAYQICGRDRADLHDLYEALRNAMRTVAEPDMYIVLHLDPVIGLARKADQAKTGTDERNHMDDRALAFHQRACDGFHQFVQKYTVPHHIIDASKSSDEVAAELDAVLTPFVRI